MERDGAQKDVDSARSEAEAKQGELIDPGGLQPSTPNKQIHPIEAQGDAAESARTPQGRRGVCQPLLSWPTNANPRQ